MTTLTPVDAYSHALDDVLLVAAGLAVVSAIVAALTIRNRDLRPVEDLGEAVPEIA